MTKTIPGTWRLHRAHINGLYQANDQVQSGERGTRYKVVVGYSVVITNELVLVADVFRDHKFQKDADQNLVEAGFRWIATPRAVLSAGVGTGFGDHSPDVRAILGLQYEF